MKLPETGIEPVRVLPRWILSPVRLPIPPLGLTFFCVVSAAQLIYQTRQSLSTTFFTFFEKSFSAQKKSGEIKFYSASAAVTKLLVTTGLDGLIFPLRKDAAKSSSPAK